jgi:folate-binding protein YgfZ
MEGEEGKSFLQGFVTGDMEEERGVGRAFYSMMLNAQGRVLFDVLIYQLSNEVYYLECDAGARDDVIKHLRKYALRTKVKFSPIEDHSVWALFPGQPQPPAVSYPYLYSPDPRHSVFGSRAVLPSHVEASSIWPTVEATDIDAYHDHRLLSGIPEGTNDIISGSSLPLECNLDYMNGVSFSKGCYLGQELTARTHHTGVTRKRIMSVTLDQIPPSPIPSGTPITSGSGRSAGKLLEHRSSLGLALLRLSETSKRLTVRDKEQDISLTAHVPDYWPDEAIDKEKL